MLRIALLILAAVSNEAYAGSRDRMIKLAQGLVSRHEQTPVSNANPPGELVMGFRAQDLEGIEKFGFLNSWQVDASPKQHRARLENEIYGFDTEQLPSLAPKYAQYFDAADGRRALSTRYGASFVKFKPDLLRRTLVTSGDSSLEGYWDLSPARAKRRVGSADSFAYSEAQTLGPIDLRDVDSVFLSSADLNQQGRVLRLARKFGFKAFYLPVEHPGPSLSNLRHAKPLDTAAPPTPGAISSGSQAPRLKEEEVLRSLQREDELFTAGRGTDDQLNALRKAIGSILGSAHIDRELLKEVHGIARGLGIEIESKHHSPFGKVPPELSIANLNLNRPDEALDILMRHEKLSPAATLHSFFQKYVYYANRAEPPRLNAEQVEFLARCWYRRYFLSNVVEPQGEATKFLRRMPQLKKEILRHLASEMKRETWPIDSSEFRTRLQDGAEGLRALTVTPQDLAITGLEEAYHSRPTPAALRALNALSPGYIGMPAQHCSSLFCRVSGRCK